MSGQGGTALDSAEHPRARWRREAGRGSAVQDEATPKFTFWAVPDNEPHYLLKIYMYILTAYLYTAITIFFLWKQYREYVILRHHFLSLPTPQQYSILVDHIPSTFRKNQIIKDYF